MTRFHWTEPTRIGEERAAFWKRARRAPAHLACLCLLFWVIFSGALLLVVWIRSGVPVIPGALIGGAILAVLVTPLFYMANRVHGIRQVIQLEEDFFSVTGNLTRSGSYAELVGFAFAGEAEMPYLLLFHPEGHHHAVGFDPAMEVGNLRAFLLTKLPELAPDDAPEPKLREIGAGK